MEQQSKAVCLDGKRGLYRGKTTALQADARKYPTRLYRAALAEKDEQITPVVYATLQLALPGKGFSNGMKRGRVSLVK